MRHPLLAGVDGHLEAAVDGGRDVIGVALGVGGELQEELLGLGLCEVLPREREPRGEAGDERGGGRAEAARGWDAVDGGELDVVHRECLVGVDGGVPVFHSLDDCVGLVAWQRGFAFADDVHLEGAALQDELVLEVDGEAEGVEARTHVRARGRDGDTVKRTRGGGWSRQREDDSTTVGFFGVLGLGEMIGTVAAGWTRVSGWKRAAGSISDRARGMR